MTTRPPSQLNGARKAAILIAIMGEEAASAIYRHLPDKDVQAVTREIAEMGRVSPEVAQEILEEYSRLAMTQDYWPRADWNLPNGCWSRLLGTPAPRIFCKKCRGCRS